MLTEKLSRHPISCEQVSNVLEYQRSTIRRTLFACRIDHESVYWTGVPTYCTYATYLFVKSGVIIICTQNLPGW